MKLAYPRDHRILSLSAVIILTILPHGYKISYLTQDWTLIDNVPNIQAKLNGPYSRIQSHSFDTNLKDTMYKF